MSGSQKQIYKLLHSEEQQSIFQNVPDVPTKNQQAVQKELNTRWPKYSNTTTANLLKLWELESGYPWKDVWAMNHHNKFFVLSSIGTCYYIGSLYRKTVKIKSGGIVAINVLLPSIVGSSIFGMYLQTKLVYEPMALTPHENHKWIIAESIGLHLATSFLYPMLFLPVSSIFFSSRFNTFPIPDDLIKTKESRKYLFDKVIKKSLNRNRRGLFATFAFNALLAGVVTIFESNQISTIYDDIINNC
ncbi:hypothetical protein BLOT_006708 [Blomia tropicalis]|nr:hypothetical protein BLOT_006708 [Blomia tropicalis]